MIPNIKLIAYGVIAAVVMSVLIYAKVIYNRAERVPELEQAISNLTAQIVNERTQAAKALEFGSEIQKQLDASRVLNDRLASRLRRALAVELSAPPADTPLTTPASGNGSLPSVFDSVNRVLATCQRDAIRLNSWIEYYQAVPAELK